MARSRVRSHVDWSRLDYLSLLQTVGTPPPEAGPSRTARWRPARESRHRPSAVLDGSAWCRYSAR